MAPTGDGTRPKAGAIVMADERPTPESVDVICVGAGLGGLAAAIRAHDAGLSVVILESAGFVGGGAAYSGGLCWLPGLADGDSLAEAEAYLAYVDGERVPSDAALRPALLARMVEATRFYERAGIAFEVVPGNPDVFYPDAPGSRASGRMYECAIPGRDLGPWERRLIASPHYRIGLRHRELYDDSLSKAAKAALFDERDGAPNDLLTMGLGLSGQFVHGALVARGIPCRTGHRVTRLLGEDGRPSGVGARCGSEKIRIEARRGVVLATGGYGWATDAADLEGLPDFAEAGPPSIRGDHLSLVAPFGAEIARGGGPQFSMGAAIDPQDRHPGSSEPVCRQLFDVMGMPHTLVVNRSGRRFGDESYYVGINEALGAWDAVGKRWVNFPCFLVFDEQYRRKYPLAGLPAAAAYPSTVRSADDLPSLAAMLGVNGASLVETVARFNANAEQGLDPDHGRGTRPFIRRRYGDRDHRPNANLGPLVQPPFYGLPLRLLGTGMCTFGLRTDVDGRVLRRDRSPVRGLYATGNACATTEFKGYVTGYANSRNIALGYAAAEAILASV